MMGIVAKFDATASQCSVGNNFDIHCRKIGTWWTTHGPHNSSLDEKETLNAKKQTTV